MAQMGERTPLVDATISLTTRTAYALGHVFNDLTAAMWFSYTLLFLQRVALLEPLTAGCFLLLGQVIDALMTPVFGVLVDKYSKKKTWHVVGSIMVIFSFPPIFGSFVRNTRSAVSMFVYVLSITIFQTGWAAVQISHLSMIPALTSSSILRTELTAIRYSAQVGAAVIVFIVTWIVLPSSEESGVRLGPTDSFKFRNIVVVLSLLGAVATILFHVFLNARLLEVSDSSASAKPGGVEAASRAPDANRHKYWFGNSLLARVAMLYVASRLFNTLATVYLPLYIEETAVGGRQALATVPLASYIASFVAALLLKYMNESCGTKVCYLLGSLIGILAAAIVEFAGSSEAVMYSVAVLIGAGSSITMVTALSITAELIGPRTESSALVYSIVTFLDKVVTGLVVIVIEKW
ncbi:PREDICTED: major facilitator superfamily domain-containing protein 12-like isoform X1 [Ceratosolen solmsi marchali]|nr:PREDICTED: major facilitator superfamily domain-containing protein 12-like isoform X1 [Ceratosolen solmsi marchali]XP_011494124.1 PREDICTED: major facilitator superfamily domain-containing protein 12-like isoform X1 [Ceratosolen solmsi marchali]XP_011494125.1 PREDICTED: major facilitator superfamily domain-containing protein 12-like isoform X1 [Ceratosolen solmsi marchali]